METTPTGEPAHIYGDKHPLEAELKNPFRKERGMDDKQIKELTQINAELRHLYKQMVNGNVFNTAAAAKGLLGPQIKRLELMIAKPIAAPINENPK